MTTATYRVNGMTCGHCVSTVTSALAAIDTVSDVEVVLDKGEATVTSGAPLEDDVVRAAVEEAGFALAP